MCRTSETSTPGRKSLRCPACSAGSQNRAYQKARYAAQKAQNAVNKGETHNVESIPSEGNVVSLRDFEEVKKEARELSADMQTAFSSPLEVESTAQKMGYENADSMYADFERRSTLIGEQVGMQAENDVGFALPENLEERIEEIRNQKVSEVKEEYQKVAVVSSVMSSMPGNRIDARRLQTKIEERGYSSEEALHMVQGFNKEKGKYVETLNKANKALPPELDEKLDDLSEAYLSRLKEIRDMGGEVEADYKTASLKKALTRSADIYPSDWIAMNNNYPLPLTVKSSSNGAHYSHMKEQTTVGYEPRARQTHILQDGRVKEASAYGKILFTSPPGSAYAYTLDPHAQVMESVSAVTHPNPQDKKPTQHPSEISGNSLPSKNSADDWEWKEYSTVKPDGSLERKEGWVNIERKMTRTSYVDHYSAELTIHKSDLGYKNIQAYDSSGRHELAHRMEDVVPGITELEAKFRERREVNEDGTPQKIQFVDSAYQHKGKPDNYVHGYIGKEYPAETDAYGRSMRSTEVLSVGVESLFSRRYGSLVGADKNVTADKDHRAFVLGILATR